MRKHIAWMLDRLFPRGALAHVLPSECVTTLFRFRGTCDNYEPLFTKILLNEIRSDDRIVEVGAYIGILTILMARRISCRGAVFAFEPDSVNRGFLNSHLRMNDLVGKVKVLPLAVSNRSGQSHFTIGGFSSAHLIDDSPDIELRKVQRVDCITLDSFLQDAGVDILKIDVEGFEQQVIEGSLRLLSDEERCPRALFIEMHPQFWSRSGATSKAILGLLHGTGYEVLDLAGQRIDRIVEYGHVVARKKSRFHRSCTR